MSVANGAPRLPILTTKLTIPPHRPDIVARPHLTARLEAGLTGKLTLVSAPPGSGKTTLVTEWLATSDGQHSVAWLGLDPGDNDPGRFLTYLVAAIRTVQPDFGTRLFNLLQTAVSSDGSVALVDLINAVSELPYREGSPLVVVLDDYHVIDSDGVHRTLAYILEHQPPTLHIVMTSRETPPLPLSLLRTRREVAEFRRDDLRFSIDEATVFLNDVMGLVLDAAQVAALEERTEGWIAGLLLAALSASETPDAASVLDGFGGEHRYVFDYLAEEVLARQSEEVQHFLETTSVLGRMSAPLVTTLSGAGQEMLDYLVDANLFTQPLDNQRAWYRYHHLFGDFLSARFQQRDPDGWRAAHRQAGAWFYAHGHRFEATEHAMAGGDHTRLAELIAEVGPLLVRRGRIPTIARWLEAIPTEVASRDPALAIQHAWVAMFSRDLARSAQWLDRIDLEQVADPEARMALHTEEAVCRATYARFAGNSDETIRLSMLALQLFAEGLGLDHPYASVPMLHLGSTLRARGDTLASIEHLRGALELSRGGGERIVELNAMSQLAAALWDLGRFEEAECAAREAIAREAEYGLQRLAMVAVARTALADILRQRGELDEARALSRKAFEIVSGSGDGEDVLSEVWALHTLALVESASGATGATRQALDELIERAERSLHDAARQRAVRGLQAHVELLLGDTARAATWDPRGYLAEPPEHPYLDGRATLTAAWLLTEQGRLAEADQALTRLIDETERAERQARQAEARLLLAAVRARAGCRDEALDLAGEAAGWALANRAWRTLVDTHPAARALLPAVRQQWTAGGRAWPDYLETWSGPAGATAAPDQSGLVEPLTERELEVLALLAEGASNRQLADQLFISVGTVKRHTHNIYTKLGVGNRTQAIVRSQQLGILDQA